MRLTQKLIERAPRPASGQRILWDDLLVGFGCRLTPTKVSFVVQWREASGKKPRLGIGRWPALSVEDARELARKRLNEQEQVRRCGGGSALAPAMREWIAHQTLHGAWRPRYAEKVGNIVGNYVEGLPSDRVKRSPAQMAAITALGQMPIATVRRAHLTEVSDKMSRGAAEQFLAIVSSFYGWAADREMCETNPARNRLRLTGGRRKRTRRLTDTELLAIWRQFRSEGGAALAAFELLLLTGARRREVTLMRWNELELKAGTWSLPAERRKNGRNDPQTFVVTLSPPALAILERLPRLASSPFVFWGKRDGKAFDFQHLMMDRVKARSGVEDWRLHDLRRYMRTGLAQLGVSQAVAELCLGHLSVKSGLVGVYDQYDYSNEMREAWLKWGSHVAELAQRL